MELSDLIKNINIVEYISQFIDLEQRGDEWWGLSCFKDEVTPSFSVRENPPFFYDYSSGQGGNVFTFVKLYFRCSSREAVEILKKYAGYDGEMPINNKKLAATMVCKQFQPPKRTTKPSSGVILPDNYMEKYEKRLDKLQIWRDEGISDASLDKFQVYYDAFSDRIVYPIRNLDGKIVNIGGRTLDPDWKEKGLRKYSYFYPWGNLNTIYGLFENKEEIKKASEIILFEGCKSVLIADTWGIHNTGAILTSHLNPQQMKILARLGCRVVFALDKDIDIKSDKNISTLKRFVNVEYVKDYEGVLDKKDSPVDKGRETFGRLYRSKCSYR